MTVPKKATRILLFGALALTLLIPSTIMNDFTAEAFKNKHSINFEPRISSGDTIGDIQIRAVFYFSEGVEVVDSFRIFNQMQGYDLTSNPMLELTGGVGNDKQMLYHVTDNAHNTFFQTSQTQYTQFDIDVYLMNDMDVYRKLSYSSCDVSNYNILTLHDGDETFSGKTKFVIADQFIFECLGYIPNCPNCGDTEDSTKTDLKSSLDYQKEQVQRY